MYDTNLLFKVQHKLNSFNNVLYNIFIDCLSLNDNIKIVCCKSFKQVTHRTVFQNTIDPFNWIPGFGIEKIICISVKIKEMIGNVNS